MPELGVGEVLNVFAEFIVFGMDNEEVVDALAAWKISG